ncbi:MAG: phosphoserine phosphatase SerB [Paracoccaceae bacterium]
MSAHGASAAEIAGAFPDADGARICVLTADPARGLSDAEIDRIVSLAGCRGGPVRRLGPAAAEFAAPHDRGGAIGGDAPDGVDVNWLPAAGRRKRLLIADMDSTIIPVECIDELADMAGVGTAVAQVTERAMAGELDFEGALEARVALLAGTALDTLERVLAERIALNPGARTLVATMAANGAHTMLVSGGFTFFADRVARLAGFAEARANTLLTRDGHLTGEVARPILGREAKREALDKALAARGLGLGDVLAVGDGANDLAMVEAAGLGVAFRAKPVLERAARARLRHGGLEALLALQGYGEDERGGG